MLVEQAEHVFPFAEPATLEPPPQYRRLRAEMPLVRVQLPYGHHAWLVTRHADVRAVLTDPRFGRAPATAPDAPRLSPLPAPRSSILSMDLPEHTRLRQLLAGAFTNRRLELLRPRIAEVTEGLLDRMAAAGPPVDLVEHLALPLPITIICELLGIPYADRESFGRWAETLQSLTAYTAAEIGRARDDLNAYLAGLLVEKRRVPTDDLLGFLVRVRDQDDRLSEPELITFGATLILAGHETTANQLANSVLILMRYPDQVELLRRQPGLVPKAVEELLRFAPTDNGSLFRIATADVEISGVTIRAGDAVCVSETSANRDEAVFTDPERLDVTREVNPHLAFGYGIHRCLGAQLARIELQVAIAALLARFPGLRLAEAEEDLIWRRSGLLLRGPRILPVAW
jgi:cytochrome P450